MEAEPRGIALAQRDLRGAGIDHEGNPPAVHSHVNFEMTAVVRFEHHAARVRSRHVGSLYGRRMGRRTGDLIGVIRREHAGAEQHSGKHENANHCPPSQSKSAVEYSMRPAKIRLTPRGASAFPMDW